MSRVTPPFVPINPETYFQNNIPTPQLTFSAPANFGHSSFQETLRCGTQTDTNNEESDGVILYLRRRVPLL